MKIGDVVVAKGICTHNTKCGSAKICCFIKKGTLLRIIVPKDRINLPHDEIAITDFNPESGWCIVKQSDVEPARLEDNLRKVITEVVEFLLDQG